MSVAVQTAAMPDPLAMATARFDWQPVIFAPEPERGALLRLQPAWPLEPRRIRFHRNHAIETALRMLGPFMAYAGIAPELLVSDYDDSLSFSDHAEADVEVVWLDFDRFTGRMTPTQAAGWLSERVAVLRGRTSAPILIVDWDGPGAGGPEFAEALRGGTRHLGAVHLADRTELFEELGSRYFDAERSRITGTRVSGVGATLTARLLGLRWLPALLEPRIKAVVVDLDQTLYAGVLGEDGADGIELTDGHLRLQQELLRLRDSGLFLGLLSRNEPADVRALFDERPDFALRFEDFSAHSISWGRKSEGLEAIARRLRIDPGAVLFVDDNAGELIEVSRAVPRVHCLHASAEGERTALAVAQYPRLWRFDASAEDSLRVADLQANEERDRLAGASDSPDSYYRELQVSLTLRRDHPEMLPRSAELSAKTNQFNLALHRYSETQLSSMLAGGEHELVAARLEDRLTDSGVIAMAVLRREADQLVVDELCISCRALGRQLEDLIVAQMVSGGALFAGASEVAFDFVPGPRNQPAQAWLARFAGQDISSGSEPVRLAVPAPRVLAASVNPNVKIGVVA